jgi:hypothetical protein
MSQCTPGTTSIFFKFPQSDTCVKHIKSGANDTKKHIPQGGRRRGKALLAL